MSREIPNDFEQTITRRPIFGRWNRHNDGQLRCFRWVCPACRKETPSIYYPLPVRTLFDSWFKDPVIKLKLSDADLLEPPPPTFACRACHNIEYFSSIAHDAWNQVISYFTGGLLYGHEVPKPVSFQTERKRTRIRQLNRRAPIREKILTRLRNGWSDEQIARDLLLTIKCVQTHLKLIRREEQVPDRDALAKKLNFAVIPPPTYIQRARHRRQAVQELLVQGLSYKEMMHKLNMSYVNLRDDILAIYKHHGLTGLKKKAPAALAAKLNLTPPKSQRQQLLEKVSLLHHQGLTRRQIAHELFRSPVTIKMCLRELRKSTVTSPSPSPSPSSQS